MTDFVNHNGITPDGKRVLAALESAIKGAGNNLAKLNDMPGYVKHYLANVVKLKSMTQETWLRDYSGSAELVLERLNEADATKAQQKATVASGIDEALAAFEKRLLAKVETLMAERATPEPAKTDAKADTDTADEDKDSNGESEA